MENGDYKLSHNWKVSVSGMNSMNESVKAKFRQMLGTNGKSCDTP